MNWLYKKYIRISPQNGRIEITRNFGEWRVAIGNSIQSNDYTIAMFVDAFEKISLIKQGGVGPVLMLGMGGGSAIKPLHTQFPDSILTVVEYDQEMIEIAKDLELYLPFPYPKVILGDAGVVVSNMDEKFDLIILDIFRETEPSPLVADETFLHSLKSHLLPEGMLLVNVSSKPGYLEPIQKIFPHSKLWKFRSNHLGAFWNK